MSKQEGSPTTLKHHLTLEQAVSLWQRLCRSRGSSLPSLGAAVSPVAGQAASSPAR